ncbi:hypothetical protein J5N97_023605 [Dioscorea zingiberensis]|uniref:Uncharacterized protein n=1 Tax=Dioscorea zingiberensis TaxID=325984 RepID=A0A9D5C5K2_9LILI|nr:hypothetical protein J5N97_023605 [Dioscorea zingiberensis]
MEVSLDVPDSQPTTAEFDAGHRPIIADMSQRSPVATTAPPRSATTASESRRAKAKPRQPFTIKRRQAAMTQSEVPKSRYEAFNVPITPLRALLAAAYLLSCHSSYAPCRAYPAAHNCSPRKGIM